MQDIRRNLPLIPVHPEAVPADGQALRWIIPPATLDLVGPVAELPSALTDLQGEIIESIAVEPTAVLIRLAPGRTWRVEGEVVRTALQAALTEPARWRPTAEQSRDDILRVATEQVIDGQVGDYVRSHGGSAALVDVRDGVVELRLAGACTHCPAADLTLTERFENAIRARAPWLQRVVSAPPAAPPGGRRRLSLTPLRRAEPRPRSTGCQVGPDAAGSGDGDEPA